MSHSSPDVWYQLGYALERTRRNPTAARVQDLAGKIAAFRGGSQAGRSRAPASGNGKAPAAHDGDGFDRLVTTLTEGLTSGVLRAWPARHRPGWIHLVRGGAAGAAAVVVQELLHAFLLRDGEALADRSRTLPDRLVAGVARGVVYGSLAEPRLPGPRILRGLVYGTVEYMASPLGGLGHLLGRFAPYARVPLVRNLVDALPSSEEGDYLDHLVFGAAVALMAASEED